MKNSKIYRQADKAWASLPYPTKASSFGGNGCGACSVLHLIIELEKYKNWTPKDINPYMKGWAEPGHGTLWNGIYEAMKHYGLESVKWFGTSSPMSSIFDELNKGDRIGIILFGSDHGPDGTEWTTSGHYIAFLDYKVKEGKHYFYLKDSGFRKHDGWFCYEKSMMNDVKQVWTATLPPEVKKKYSGTLPSLNYTSNDEFIKEQLKWAKAHFDEPYKRYNSGDDQTKKCYLCHPKTVKKKGFNCIGFNSAMYFHCGVKAVKCSQSGLCNDAMMQFDKFKMADWKERNGDDWVLVAKKDGRVPESMLRNGDLVHFYDGHTWKHIGWYYNGYIYDSRGSRGGGRQKYSSYKGDHTPKIVIRFTGKQKTIKKNLVKGDRRTTQVKQLQRFLNWYGGYGLKVDGNYGNKTAAAVKNFKTAEKLPDKNGKVFGKTALAKAKVVKK